MAKLKQAEDSVNARVDAQLAKAEAQLDSLIANKTDSLTTEVLDKIGVTKAKDSTIEEAKEKAKSVLKGLLKKKKKKNNDN